MYYIKNHLGSTAAVINDKGELIEATMYTAYGEQIPLMVLPGTEAAAREKFTGKEFDTEGGINLDYFGARYYDPEIGYWISCDPDEQFYNPYSYTANGYNPLRFIDPNGKSLEDYIGTFYLGISGSVMRTTFPGAQAIGATVNLIHFSASALNLEFALGMGFVAAGTAGGAIFSGQFANADGFLFGSLYMSRGIPIALPLVRWGSMEGNNRAFSLNFSRISGLLPQYSQFMTRVFGSVKPGWNSLTNLTFARLPAKTPFRLGIASPQGGKQIGGLLQFNLKPETVEILRSIQNFKSDLLK